MAYLFDSFAGWKAYSEQHSKSLVDIVIEYEESQRGRDKRAILEGLDKAWQVMKEAVHSGLEEEMVSRSGMINNGAKKVYRHPLPVLSKDFQKLISRALAAKEVNSCMGRVVAAPTAGASGIMPGVLVTLQEIHHIKDDEILNDLLVSEAIENTASSTPASMASSSSNPTICSVKPRTDWVRCMIGLR